MILARGNVKWEATGILPQWGDALTRFKTPGRWREPIIRTVLSTWPAKFRRKARATMMIRFVAFGVLCGATAAVCMLTAGAGLLAAFAAYSLVGSLGLLAFAVTSMQD